MADVELISPTTGKVSFRPTVQEQKNLIKKKTTPGKLNKEEQAESFSGQFIVEYDVSRDPSGGQVLVRLLFTLLRLKSNLWIYHIPKLKLKEKLI